MSEAALWVDAQGTGTEITVNVQLLTHEDGDTDMEIELPFGALGGVLVVHLGHGIDPLQTRFQHNHQRRAS